MEYLGTGEKKQTREKKVNPPGGKRGGGKKGGRGGEGKHSLAVGMPRVRLDHRPLLGPVVPDPHRRVERAGDQIARVGREGDARAAAAGGRG